MSEAPTPEGPPGPSSADLWAAHGFSAELRDRIGRFLTGEREAIVDAGTSWVIRTAVDLQGRRPREETRGLVDRATDFHLAYLLEDDREPQRTFIEFVTTYRASDQFHISTLLRGFLSFKKGAESLLPRCPIEPVEQIRLLQLLDESSMDAIYVMSDLYVGKLNATIRDAREREVRAEAREAQLMLERERNLALEEAKQAAEAANEAKSRFLAHMSHELRTPLNSVIGFSRHLMDDEEISATNRRTVHNIYQSGQALLDMINEVLEMSRIEAGAMEVKTSPVDLPAFLRQLYIILAPHVTPGVRFDIRQEGTLDQHFRTDRSKLRQILLNLIGNALKFTDEGHVLCTVRQQAGIGKGPPHLEFIIADTGPGIATEELETIFDAFTQSDAGVATGKGAGLGLSITDSYVTALGGTLRANSAVGEGTTFSFSLPVEVAETSPTPSSAAPFPPEEAAAFRILVVDDHQVNRELIRATLTRWNFQVEECTGGRDAVDRIQTWRPHLVFMDIRMSDMDGLTATRRVHEQLGNDAPIIVAHTASVFGDVRQEAARAGCDDFPPKPFERRTMARILRRQLAEATPRTGPEHDPMVAASEVLSEVERAALRRAAVQLDLAYFERWLNEATDLDPAIKDPIQGWIEEFHFEKVLQWIDA